MTILTLSILLRTSAWASPGHKPFSFCCIDHLEYKEIHPLDNTFVCAFLCFQPFSFNKWCIFKRQFFVSFFNIIIIFHKPIKIHLTYCAKKLSQILNDIWITQCRRIGYFDTWQPLTRKSRFFLWMEFCSEWRHTVKKTQTISDIVDKFEQLPIVQNKSGVSFVMELFLFFLWWLEFFITG